MLVWKLLCFKHCASWLHVKPGLHCIICLFIYLLLSMQQYIKLLDICSGLRTHNVMYILLVELVPLLPDYWKNTSGCNIFFIKISVSGFALFAKYVYTLLRLKLHTFSVCVYNASRKYSQCILELKYWSSLLKGIVTITRPGLI